jgi:hypothetical protein
MAHSEIDWTCFGRSKGRWISATLMAPKSRQHRSVAHTSRIVLGRQPPGLRLATRLPITRGNQARSAKLLDKELTGNSSRRYSPNCLGI